MDPYCGPAEILDNRAIADGIYSMSLALPAAFKASEPGQFLHVQIREGLDPFLRRPFSVYNVAPLPGRRSLCRVTFLYDVVGRGTALLSEMARGDRVDVLGPLGRAYTNQPRARVTFLVGGGIGIPPMYFIAKRFFTREAQARDDRWYALLGARTKNKLCAVRDFQKLGITVLTATDDGSSGHRGRVTDLMEQFVPMEIRFGRPVRLYGCGPEPMLEKMVSFAKLDRIPCQISMERRMGCGLGACRACVCKVIDEKHPDGRVVASCREGPVFSAAELPAGPWW